MTPEKIREARRLAREFVKLADAALATERQIVPCVGKPLAWIDPSPTTGALRRRSMDLTRALADMRRPG